MLPTTSPPMSSNDLTGNNQPAILLVLALVAGVCLSGCSRMPPQKMVYVQWQALCLYHPLWQSQQMGWNFQPSYAVTGHQGFAVRFSLPQTTLHPLQTPESERRRQRIAQTSAQQQQALNARLRQMEARLLQEELAQLGAEQKTEVELARQQLLLQAEQQISEALRPVSYTHLRAHETSLHASNCCCRRNSRYRRHCVNTICRKRTPKSGGWCCSGWFVSAPISATC